MARLISLRLDPAAVTARARKLLLELEQKDLQQRRVRRLAGRALIAIYAMSGFMTLDERNRCRTEVAQVQAFLEKIRNRGA